MMNRIACAAILIAGSMQAQTGPPAQATAPAGHEVASQNQPPPPTFRWDAPVTEEARKKAEEARKKPQELGYFNSGQTKVRFVMPVTQCAIPLSSIPVPDNAGFASKKTPANPSIDPKIVLAPPLPACRESTPPTITNPEPSPKKQAGQANDNEGPSIQ